MALIASCDFIILALRAGKIQLPAHDTPYLTKTKNHFKYYKLTLRNGKYFLINEDLSKLRLKVYFLHHN